MPSEAYSITLIPIALITISTRASLKKYHTFNLNLGASDGHDGWEFSRIGTKQEKMQMEREFQELSNQLSKVDEWRRRRVEIDRELAEVLVEGGVLGKDE